MRTLTLFRTKQYADSTLRFASTSKEQTQVTVEDDTEELSGTRLLAQNVPRRSP